MTPLERDNFAAEYVLGLLEKADAARAETLLAEDTAFSAAVADWRLRFAELDETAAPMAPAGDLWSRIDAQIVAPPVAARAPERPAEPGWWRTLWDDLTFWRGAAMAGAAAILALAVGLGVALQSAARTPQFVAILLTEGSSEPAAVVNAFTDGRVELVPLRDIEVPSDRSLQIWTLWDRAVGPRSVGLISNARSTKLDLNSLPTTGPNQLFEITLEPKNGSPTGRPTGPILMKGLTATAL
jgi:anti-sigma-K factor RskA